MTNKISYYKSLLNTTESVEVTVDQILNGIKGGKARVLVESIRSETDKSRRADKKKSLAAICFSGVFERRSDSAIKSHSGFICLDFDGYSVQELSEAMRQFRADEYTYAAFVSPSGLGIKVLVRIPAEVDTHGLRFASLKDHYNSDKFDETSSNLSRVCFMSYDPDTYINKGSKIYLGIKEAVKPVSRDYNEVLIPVTSNNDIVTRLVGWHNKNYSMSEGGRNNNVFILAKALCEHGISMSETEGICLQYEQADFKTEEILVAVGSAYSDQSIFNTKVLEDNDTLVKAKSAIKRGDGVDSVRDVLLRENVPADKIDLIVETLEKEKSQDVFWEVSDKGRVKISNADLDSVLTRHGYTRASFNGHTEFVKVADNIATPIDVSDIKDFVVNDILRPADNRTVFDAITASKTTFQANNLDMLKPTKLTINRDTATMSYVYFKNGVVVMTKNYGRQFIPISEVNGCVWADSVIDHNYIEEEVTECDFKTFVNNVSNNVPERINSMETALGYMLHNYKDSANPKAVVLYDEVAGEGANGGTGKSLFADAISEIRRSVSIDGKNVKSGSNFMYQRVSLDTRVINFDDVTKGFEFEKLFSVITEGVTVERKGTDEFHIPFEDAPKIIVSSNYALKGEGKSFDRRTHTLEFNQFYTPSHTPSKVAGRRFFETEWKDSGEFNKFYNYMLQCLQTYLNDGLAPPFLLGEKLRKFTRWCPPSALSLFGLDSDVDPFIGQGTLDIGGLRNIFMDSIEGLTPMEVITLIRSYGWLKYNKDIVTEATIGQETLYHFPND